MKKIEKEVMKLKKDDANNNKKEDNVSRIVHEIAPCQEHFRLFSYLAMAILTIAIFVGLFLMIQHLEEEAASEKTIAAQESVLKNQELLLQLNKDQSNNQGNIIKIINITNRDNTEFFAILDNMTKDLDKIKEYLEIKT